VPQKSFDYSINVGVLGTTIGGKETRTPLGLVPDDIYPNVATIADAPEHGEEILIEFEKGVAVSVNGVAMSGLTLIDAVRDVAQRHGVGRGTHLGTTILGIKGRIVFEAAALRVLIEGHKELEKSVLSSKQIFWKDHLGVVWGDSVHEGLYFDPVVADIGAMITSSQRTVTGTVTMKLHKGNIIVVGSQSRYSLMDSTFASYGEENSFWDGRDAAGFSRIYGLEGVIAHKKHNKV
jgi:argininosuccinate synthase